MWKRWNPWTEMDALRREIDRVFEGYGQSPKRWQRSLFLPGRHARAYPLLNVSEDAEAVYVEALAPGLDIENLDLSITGNTLTLQGEKKPLQDVRPEQYHRNERAAGNFVRTLEINAEVDAEKVTAEYTNGVLLVTLPKSEKARPKQISVDVK